MLSCTFLCHHCTTMMWKCLISHFVEDVTTRQSLSFSFLKLQYSFFFQKKFPTYFEELRWLNTVLAVCEYMSFTKSWQEKGCSSQAETWQVKNILMKDFDWQVKCDVFVVSIATLMIEYNPKGTLFFSLRKIYSLDFPINLHTAYYIINHYHLKLIRPNFNRQVFR